MAVFETSEEGGVTVLRITRDVFPESDDEARGVPHELGLAIAGREKQRMLVDLEGVTTFSSRSAHELAAIFGQVARRGGSARVCNVHPIVENLFRNTGVRHALDVRPTRAEAMADWQE